MNLQKELSTKAERRKAAFLYTFFWGLAAHGFAFANLSLSHDSLNEFYIYDTIQMKLSLGRFSQPLFRLAMGETVTLPWLTGIVSLLLLFGAVYLTVEIFELKHTGEIALLSGILTANLSVTALIATYVHDLAGDMAALYLSVIAVFLWKKTRSQFHAGLFCLAAAAIALSLGFYQAFLCITVVMVMLYSILELLKGEKALRVFRDGMYAIGILAAAFLLYAGLLVLSGRLTGIPLSSGEYNDLSNLSSIRQSPIRKILWALVHVLWGFCGLRYGEFSADALLIPLNVNTLWMYLRAILNLGVLLLTAALLLTGLFRRKRGKWENLLLVTLVLALPIGMDLTFIGSGSTHVLMQYAYWLVYLFLGLLLKWAAEENLLPAPRLHAASLAAAGMVLILLVNMVETSNALYVKKELEHKATLSTMTRVLSRLEAHDDYVYGETPVALICEAGITAQAGLPGTEQLSDIIGSWCHSDIVFNRHFEKYLQNILQYPINICDAEELQSLQYREEVREMPVFPHRDCIQMIDGILVVKMGDY